MEDSEAVELTDTEMEAAVVVLAVVALANQMKTKAMQKVSAAVPTTPAWTRTTRPA
jgi:hypothetical protein